MDHMMFKQRARNESRSSCRFYERVFMQDDTNQRQKMVLLRELLFYVLKEVLENFVFGCRSAAWDRV
eukprot:snap_masked-scaffold_2-processed-gene-4.26-mRNA-1 protein AED:1.00 eAED:1.00 QI:0/0/0/0/1/1/2/0/66